MITTANLIQTAKNSEGLTIFTGQKPEVKPSLSIPAKQAVSLKYSYPRCSDLLKDNEGYNEILIILNLYMQKAKLIAGWKMQNEFTNEEKKVLVNKMIDVLKKPEFSSITSGHLKHVLELGLQGEFDTEQNKSFAINARTLRSWIASYKENTLDKAVTEQNQYLADEELRKERLKKDQNFQQNKIDNYSLFSHKFKMCQRMGWTDKEITEVFNVFLWHKEFKRLGAYDYVKREDVEKMFNQAAKRFKVKGKQDTVHMARAEQYCREKIFVAHIRKLMAENVDIDKYLDGLKENKNVAPF